MSIAFRPHFEWRLRTRILSLGSRTLIMGILNLTPDSFSDGGQFGDPDAALSHALQMLDDGADLLDLGGESTRPASISISPVQEQARVLPVLRSIVKARPDAVLSVDTYHAETARLAVEAGAEIINDVSGHLWDPQMSATCAELRCGTILMHTRGRPQEWRSQPRLAAEEVTPLVVQDLEARTRAALGAGVAHEAIVVDPGFGFGKILDENYPLLAGVAKLRTLGFPILAGVSRKSFLHRAAAQSATQRVVGEAGPAHNPAASTWDPLPTAVANTAAILAGAHILRVHDVRPAIETAAIADRILANSSQS